MFIDELRTRIAPFMQKFRLLKPKDLVSFKDILGKESTKTYTTKSIIAEDVLGYCQVHDIDLNIYRYFISFPGSADYFDPMELEWNLILNNNPIDYYDDEKTFVSFKDINNKILNGPSKVNPFKIPNTTKVIKTQNDFINFANSILLNGNENKDKLDYRTSTFDLQTMEDARRDMHAIIDYNMEISDNTIPILDVSYDKDMAPERSELEKAFIKIYLRHYPNTRTYNYEKKVLKEYDDDETFDNVFKEEEKFIDNHTFDKFKRYRVEMIHGHLYIFFINKEDKPKDLWSVEPTDVFPNMSVTQASASRAGKNITHYPYSVIQNDSGEKVLQYGGLSKFGVTIDHPYFMITGDTPNLDTHIRNIINKIIKDNKLDENPEAKKLMESYIFDDNGELQIQFITKILSDISIAGYVYLSDDINISHDDIVLWDLKSPSFTNVEIAVYYIGDIRASILDYVAKIAKGIEIPEIHLRDQINIFNKLTNNQLRHKLIEKGFTLNKAITLKEGFESERVEKLAERLMKEDYDLFMCWDKVRHKANLRLDLADAEFTTITRNELKHYNFSDIDEDSQKFIKLAFPNFEDNPFDLYICNLYYDGLKIVEREHHWTYFYIPLLQLYKFLEDHELTNIIFKENTDEDVEVLDYV